jgi:GntR family transcriptional regulator, transcriptional repressor for pyruvate dehydrogenase complex
LIVAVQTEPVQRQLVSEAVFESLLSDVLAGRLEAGDPLPSERALSETFGVNRHAVREAIKRLQQAGLVQVAQGGATRVRDWRRTAGLDLLVSLVGTARGAERDGLLRDVLEMRAAVGADVARACAERSPRQLSPATGAEAYAVLWEQIADGAGNLAYRLALNTLIAAQRSGAIDPATYASEYGDFAAQAALLDAIGRGNTDRAGYLARDLLDRSIP